MATKLDLINFTANHKLPDSYALMDPLLMYTVDLTSTHGNYACTGVTLICKKNVTFIEQLLQMDSQWQLHGDGKHKLRHGKWILVTFGTHCLAWDRRQKGYRHSFR